MSGTAPKSAMVLAAGLGTRMRPLTDRRPKALVEVGGRALIDHVLDRLKEAGVERAVVNVHAHADRLEAHLKARKSGPEILVSDERDLLCDTGGGLRKALPLLGPGPLFVINADALWRDGRENTLLALAHGWASEAMDGLLLIVHAHAAIGYSGRGDFMMDEAGRLGPRPERSITPYVYGGVQILAPEAVEAIEREVFSLRELWTRAIEQGRLFGIVHEGLWAHVGTPEAVAIAERKLFG